VILAIASGRGGSGRRAGGSTRPVGSSTRPRPRCASFYGAFTPSSSAGSATPPKSCGQEISKPYSRLDASRRRYRTCLGEAPPAHRLILDLLLSRPEAARERCSRCAAAPSGFLNYSSPRPASRLSEGLPERFLAARKGTAGRRKAAERPVQPHARRSGRLSPPAARRRHSGAESFPLAEHQLELMLRLSRSTDKQGLHWLQHFIDKLLRGSPLSRHVTPRLGLTIMNWWIAALF
jgi:hypothetical protein